MAQEEYDLTNLVNDLHETTHQNKEHIRGLLTNAFEQIGKAVAKHGKVELKGLGVIKLAKKQASSGELNGTRWEKPEHFAIKMRPSDTLYRVAQEANESETEIMR